MATLAGNTIASTYPLLLKVDSNGLDGTLRAIQDGDATDSVLYLATDSALISGNGTKLYFFDADGDEHISADNAGNLTIGAGNDIVLAMGSGGDVYSVGADGNTGNTIFGKDAFNTSTNNASDYNTFIGELAAGTGSVAGAVNNVGVGYKTLNALTSGENNIAIGFEALDANLTGDLNVAIGTSALGAFIGSASVAIGREALRDLNHASAADGTIAIGTGAGASLTSGAANVAIGYQALDAEDVGNYSTAVGYQALTAQSTTHADPVTNTDSGNTAVGFKAGFAVSTGIYNTIMGRTAGLAINSGASNTVMGSEAGKAMTTTGATVLIGKSAGEAINSADADGTVAIGKDALKALTDGQNNIAIGHVAADVMTVSNRNVIIGAEAFTTAGTATGQDDNIGIGYRALNSANVQDFNRNVAIGSYSMFSSGTNQQTGTVAIGYSALGDLTSGVRNTGVGYTSIYANTTGADNTALGYGSLSGLNHADGDHNTAVGVNGGSNLVTGYQNTFIGSNNQPASSSTTNSATIGYAVTAVASNSVTLGNASVTAVYAGSDSGATVHAGSVISNSNYALEGYSTGRNVLRVIKYKFEDATDANKVKITATSLFNGDAVSVVDNISTGAVTNYNFQASFGELRVGYANFTGNVVGIISCETLRNTTGTDMMVQVNNSSANSRIEVYFRNRTSGAELNMEDLVDSGYLEVSLAYITSS